MKKAYGSSIDDPEPSILQYMVSQERETRFNLEKKKRKRLSNLKQLKVDQNAFKSKSNPMFLYIYVHMCFKVLKRYYKIKENYDWDSFSDSSSSSLKSISESESSSMESVVANKRRGGKAIFEGPKFFNDEFLENQDSLSSSSSSSVDKRRDYVTDMLL
jgi:hypothetical protein